MTHIYNCSRLEDLINPNKGGFIDFLFNPFQEISINIYIYRKNLFYFLMERKHFSAKIQEAQGPNDVHLLLLLIINVEEGFYVYMYQKFYVYIFFRRKTAHTLFYLYEKLYRYGIMYIRDFVIFNAECLIVIRKDR